MARGLPFEAAGSARLLRFDMNALCRIEEAMGCSLNEAVSRLDGKSGSPSMRDIRTIFGAGLGGSVLSDKVGEIIDEIGLDHAVSMIGSALELAFPKAVEAAADAAGNGPGTAI